MISNEYVSIYLFRINKMDILNDEWLVIFKMFNLNERTNLRLVSKRFKCLLDMIKITKLIIYEKSPTLPVQPNYADESNSLQDTVYVYDLNKFFNNPTILDQMEPIRQLVIEGSKSETEIDLKTGFKKLTYLRLRNVKFTNSSLLQSTELEHLTLQDSFFHSFGKCISDFGGIYQIIQSDYNRSVFNHKFNDLKSRKLKYLKLISADFEGLRCWIQHGLFHSLEEIDITFFDFESLILLNNRCPALKIVNCQVGKDKEAFLREVDTIEYASEQLRDDLLVYLFGMYAPTLLIQQVLLEQSK